MRIDFTVVEPLRGPETSEALFGVGVLQWIKGRTWVQKLYLPSKFTTKDGAE